MPDEITLWQLVRRSWWVLLLATLVAGIAAYSIAQVLPKSYQSTVTLLVGPVNTDTGLDASGTLTATYESLATSEPVLAKAISVAHANTTPSQLQNDVTTTSNTVSRLVTVTASDPDPEIAAKIANAIAAQVSHLAQTTSRATTETITAFDKSPQLATLPDGQRVIAESALRTVLGVSPAGQVSIINPAFPAASAASPQKSLIAILGAFAGLLISGMALLARANRSRAAADQGSLTKIKHTYLGAVDVLPINGNGHAVSVEAQPNSASAAEYRMLAARLSLTESVSRSLLVVDSSDGTAAAVVAANLAAALSQGMGRSVVLADVSTETEGVTKLLGLQGQSGFAELVAAPDIDALNGRVGELLVDLSGQVCVLPRGSGEPGPALSVERARAVIRRLGENLELVVIAGPPISRSASALSWAKAAGSVLFVVDDKTSQEEVLQATRDLSLANTHFLGTVTGRRRTALPVLGRRVVSRG